MTKKMWDLYAPIYERAMRSDRRIYQFMYDRIPEVIRNKDVLEIATGPGLLAKHVASAARTIIATDYSEGMIAQAKKGTNPTKLRFEVADATELPLGQGETNPNRFFRAYFSQYCLICLDNTPVLSAAASLS